MIWGSWNFILYYALTSKLFCKFSSFTDCPPAIGSSLLAFPHAYHKTLCTHYYLTVVSDISLSPQAGQPQNLSAFAHSVLGHFWCIVFHQPVKAFWFILECTLFKIFISLLNNLLLVSFITNTAFLFGKHILIVKIRDIDTTYPARSRKDPLSAKQGSRICNSFRQNICFISIRRFRQQPFIVPWL